MDACGQKSESTEKVIGTTVDPRLSEPRLSEPHWFKVQEIIITSSFIIISARAMYTSINFLLASMTASC